jgi:hypothetical protein
VKPLRILGHTLYRGPSLLDGAPIVVLSPTRVHNSKTGDLLQTYIIRSDISPLTALRTKQDSSICGQCPNRPALIKETNEPCCYVNVGRAPQQVYEGFIDGMYPPASPSSVGHLRRIRLGAYGDPAAVPIEIWDALLSRCLGYTGYTHQWRASFAQCLRPYCMASCNSESDYFEARALGWRTFRIGTSLLPGEFSCPASAEQNHRLTCSQCLACDGYDSSRPRKASVLIQPHGPSARKTYASLTLNRQVPMVSRSYPKEPARSVG